jgi:RNA polymerase sigma-70 factor (ECF subfamily)
MLLEDEQATDLSALSDEEVLTQSLSKPAMFEILIDRYQDALLRKAVSIVRSPEEAEDIVQETFTKVYFNARRFVPQQGATLRSWIYKILMNTTFTHYQKLKKKGSMREDLDPEIFEGLADSRNVAHEDMMRDYVASFLSRMPDQLARPLKLHFVDEYSQKEIAEMEGTTVSAIKTRIYRAKREFNKLLESAKAQEEK